MMQQKVSVLFPCYNAQKYLRLAIDSIVNQTYRNLEIILINDGSTDSTGKIIEEFASRDKRIVVVNNPVNLGLIKTLNKGVTYVSGYYTARMDADDISQSDRIEKLVEYFENNPGMDVIAGGSYYINTNGKVIRKVRPRAILSEALKFVALFSTPVNHPSVMARSEVFKTNHYDEDFVHSEDYELFSRLLFMDYKFMNVEDPLYFLRLNPESVSNKYEKIQISTHTTISRRNINNYFNEIPDFFLHKVLINRISFVVKASLLREAFRKIESMRDEFVLRENSTPQIIQEINEFIIEQKIDILLQSMKQSDWKSLPGLIFQLVLNIKLFFDQRGKKYFLSKLNL